MATHRSPRAALALCLAGLTASAGLVTGPALAAPAEQPSIESVSQQVTALEAQARDAAEQYAKAQQAVAESEAELLEVERHVAATEAKLASSQRALAQLAAESYRTGALDPGMLRVVFEDDPADVLHQAAAYAHVLESQDQTVSRVNDVKADLAADREALAAQVADLEEQRAVAAKHKAVVEQKTAEAKKLLATLQEEERRRLAEEAARAAAAAKEARAAREARASRSSGRASLSGGSTAAPRSTGSCPPSGSRGAETGLTPATLSIMRCGLAAFPQIAHAGGLGTRGNATDHDNGRAVDFMIPGYRSASGNDLGWEVAEWATKQPGVSYVIFDQMIFGTWSGRWEPMENRGSDTANHRDHVHVSVGG